MQMLENESILFEKAANMVKTTIISNKGGKIILTDQRLIFVSSILGANPKVETEIPLSDIISYREAYTIMVGNLLPIKNSFSVFTKSNASHKFTMNSRDELFQHFKRLIPMAEHLPDEKYTEGLANIGGKVVSNVKDAIAGTRGSNMTSNNTSDTTTVYCPSCNAPNQKTAKFCNCCGEKLQLECPNCQFPIEEGKKFCSECGTPIKRKNECQKCGAIFTKGQKFCNECGERLGE